MKPVTSHSPLDRFLTQLGGERLSFPHPAEDLAVIQTHISLVLLAGEFAYKIKKPVHFPFVDYSTLEKRRDFCRLEVDLNRRLTEDLYLEVVPLTLKEGTIEVGGKGVPLEFAVKMKRLPDERRLGQILQSATLPEEFWNKLAYRLVRFYRDGAQGPKVSKWARPEAVEEDLKQVFSQLGGLPPETLHPLLIERLESMALKSLMGYWGRIEKRVPLAREGHGDLRLEHIYYFPDEPEPKDLALIDCVEFNPRYRCCDTMADIAFLIMDLEAGGFGTEALRFKESYHLASGEAQDGLMDFYVAYRHLVRGLVRGLQSTELDADAEYQAKAKKKSQAHFLMALGKLEQPGQRPCLILLGGLPGAGKSTLAERLAPLENLQTFSSDMTRKKLAGQSPESQPATRFEKGLYKPEWTERTYATLLERTEEALRTGKRVLVDASFRSESWRERFKGLAEDLGIPFLFFVCTVSHQTAGQRLSEARQFGSDADLEIYRKMAQQWEGPSPVLGTLFLNTERPIAVNLDWIKGILVEKGLSLKENNIQMK